MNGASNDRGSTAPRVTIVGGGLAGMAAAAALIEHGCEVELFEARRYLGGRASSFTDPSTGEVVDNCQHVSLGCCTNLSDFCRRTNIERHFVRERTLHFLSPQGRRYDFSPGKLLPAPLHLGPALASLGFLSWGDRYRIALSLLRLARARFSSDDRRDMWSWLQAERQSRYAIASFWEPILLGALAEQLDRVSCAAAQKVFVDGLMRHHAACDVLVPQLPLGQLYDAALRPWFEQHGISIHSGQAIERLVIGTGPNDQPVVTHMQFSGGECRAVEQVVVAVPWRRLPALLADAPRVDGWTVSEDVANLEPSPITGVHLWFDRPICELPHAILLGTLSQWLFKPPWSTDRAGHYYQVVISGSRNLEQRPRDEVVPEIVGELQWLSSAASEAKLLHWRMVTEPQAVFSPHPGSDRWRPTATTPYANLALAGDWIATGWPATMESAVRSGYLAAEAVLRNLNRPQRVLIDDLPLAKLTHWLTGK